MVSCWECKTLFSIAKEIKVADTIANIVAFSPPMKVSYEIKENPEGKHRGSCYNRTEFKHKEYDNVQYPWIEQDCYQIQKCSNKKRIILLHLRNVMNNQENKLTYIFSHGNSCDLGTTYSFLVDLSSQLKADIISYDYSGYGRSEGTASEKDLYSDIDQVMDFAITYQRIKIENIILIGNSLGSVPTVHIAIQVKYENVKGVILLSPIASGIKLINPKLSLTTEDLEKVDFFSNLSKVSNINCPVFLIHGMQDEVIPQTQSLELMHKVKYPYEWFPSRGTHDNIISKYRSKFYSKIKQFLELLNYSNKKINNKHEIDLCNEGNTNTTKISITKKKTMKNIPCEENYIRCENNLDSKIQSSPIKMLVVIEEHSNSGTKENKIIDHCLSIHKANVFDINSNENLFPTKSIENEGEYIFSEDRISDCYYNYKDAKELEYQFNQIEKHVAN